MRILFLIIFLAITNCSFFNQVLYADNEKTILVIGDSLSAGFGLDLADTWVTLLEKKLKREDYGYKVINASISGDTTRNGLNRLSRAIDIHQPEILIIELGGNDGLRGLPINIMQQNLEKMIQIAKQKNSLIILAGIQIPPNYGEKYAGDFAAVYPRLAKKYQVLLIPFFMKNVALNPGMLQPDGIHPNKKAQPLLMENVWKTLEAALKNSRAN
ncbi:MAG: arylesterase [Pseudomonadota bacterium]|nr:arylesterase [Pseudomonadota bacterium]